MGDIVDTSHELKRIFIDGFIEFRVLCSNSLLRCNDRGSVRTKCKDQCLPNNECWQQTVIERCSCQGYKSHLKETGVFGYDGEGSFQTYLYSIFHIDHSEK